MPGLLEGLQERQDAVEEALVLAPGEDVPLLERSDLLVASTEASEVLVHEREQRLRSAVQVLRGDRGGDAAPGGPRGFAGKQRGLEPEVLLWSNAAWSHRCCSGVGQ